jgi:uncharacterized membrane protein YedE/YeeE
VLIIGLLVSFLPGSVKPAAAEGEKAAIKSAIGFERDGANLLARKRWSPYAVGFAIGVLSWIAFLLMGKGLGASSSFAKTGGMIEKAIGGEKSVQKAYYRKVPPVINSGWMLVAGIIGGSFLSATLSGDFHFTAIPPLWRTLFGDNVPIRIFVAFVGGMILIIGARWAGGCTSGHGITGGLQLAVSSWMALIAFFVGGVITAYVMSSLAV